MYISKWVLALVIIFMACPTVHINAQQHDWEFDKMQKRTLEKQKEMDSMLVHLKNRWEIKVTYGKYYLSEGEKSTSDELFFFPGAMNIWQLSGVWHFREKWCAEMTLGIQQKKEVPPTPDIFSILSGDDIEIEGSGGAFLPIDLGVKYYFMNKRCRPYLGVSNGIVIAGSKYIIAEGNVSNGITRTTYPSNGIAWFGKLSTGLDCRIGKHTSASLNGAYYLSDRFGEQIGGYLRYSGFVVNLGFAVVL